jgi:hypothetical protein
MSVPNCVDCEFYCKKTDLCTITKCYFFGELEQEAREGEKEALAFSRKMQKIYNNSSDNAKYGFCVGLFPNEKVYRELNTKEICTLIKLAQAEKKVEY